MKLHMRIDKSDSQHTHITIFIDGKNCGNLCVGTDDVAHLHMILSHGMNMPGDEFVSSGYVWRGGDE
jgi:hypothetical protein